MARFNETINGEDLKRFVGDVPTMFKGLTTRVYRHTAPPRSAIKAKCVECMGYEEAIKRVRECTTKRCPLWAYRPYQEKRDE